MDVSYANAANLLERMNLAEGKQMLVAPEEVELESVLSSQGATGTVHRGRFKGHQVAVKTYDISNPSPEVLNSFKCEITVLLSTTSGCRHIVKCFGVTVKGDKFCVIMKLYDRTLTHRIQQSSETGLPIPAVLHYSHDIIKALIELHGLGVIVNDLKPDNILLDDGTDEAVLTDFGISRVVWNTCGKYTTENVQGTFPYMAPEQFEPSKNGITNKADIWAFGCTLLHMLTGKMPWERYVHVEIMKAVTLDMKIPHIPDGIPQRMAQLLTRCLAHKPKERPAAIEVFRELQVLSLPQAPQAAAFLQDYTSLSLLHEYVQEVVGHLQTVVGDCSSQLEAVRADQLRQSNDISHLAVQLNALKNGRTLPSAQQVVYSSRMSDAIVDFRLGLAETGDAQLDAQLLQIVEDNATSPQAIQCNTTSLLPDAGWSLAAAMLTSHSLRQLDIRGASLGNEGAKALAEALLNSPPLTRLTLCQCNIGPEGGRLIAQALKRNKHLKVLKLDSNLIGDQGLAAFASLLTTNTCLALLSLNENAVTDAAPLADALARPSCHLIELGLAQNQLLSWEALGSAIGSNTSLQSLHLHYCNLDVPTANQLANGLRANKTLRVLNINFSRCGKECIDSIAEALKVNSTLCELHIAGNQLGDDGAKLMAAALTKNTGLEKLKLDCNMICERGAAALAAALTLNTRLSSLSLFDNAIGDKGARRIGETLQEKGSSLLHLSVKHNKMGGQTKRWLYQLVPKTLKLEV